MYWFWSKSEWEIIIDHWCGKKDAKSANVDVYDQVKLNWSRFCEYVWEHKGELRSPDVKREKKT